jgi:hypothetical protein
MTGTFMIAMLTACSNVARSGELLPGDRNEVPAQRGAALKIPMPVLDRMLEQPAEIEPAEPAAAVALNCSTQSGPRRLGEQPSPPETEDQGKSDFSGEWRLLIQNHLGKRTVKLFLNQSRDRLEGRIDDPAVGETRLHGSVFGNSVRFSTEADVQGFTVRSSYQGTRIGSGLAGTVVIRTIRRAKPPDREGIPRSDIPERTCTWSAHRVKP